MSDWCAWSAISLSLSATMIGPCYIRFFCLSSPLLSLCCNFFFLWLSAFVISCICTFMYLRCLSNLKKTSSKNSWKLISFENGPEIESYAAATSIIRIMLWAGKRVGLGYVFEYTGRIGRVWKHRGRVGRVWSFAGRVRVPKMVPARYFMLLYPSVSLIF